MAVPAVAHDATGSGAFLQTAHDAIRSHRRQFGRRAIAYISGDTSPKCQSSIDDLGLR
jgi:hypothetical protein